VTIYLGIGFKKSCYEAISGTLGDSCNLSYIIANKYVIDSRLIQKH
jgi:hypothetical protein